jgi:membrane associated rhomboid family serine protease
MIPIRDENPTRRPALATVALIVVCVGVFVFVQPEGTRSLDTKNQAEVIEEIEFTYEYAAIPCEITQGRSLTFAEINRSLSGDENSCADSPNGRTPFPDKLLWTSVVVSMFLHGSWFHLGGNMLFLWVFGNNIEDHMGVIRYLAFYVLAGAVATLAHVVVQVDSTVPLVGASGAIAGVMGAYLVWFPWARVRTFILLLVIPLWPRIPAWALLAVWFVTQFFTSPDAAVAWMAHVGGFVFGVIVAFLARTNDGFRNRLWNHRHQVHRQGWDNRLGPI